MRIFNIIMNRKLDGAEQAFLDYYSALTLKGHEVVNITPTVVKDSILATGLMKVYHHGFDN